MADGERPADEKGVERATGQGRSPINVDRKLVCICRNYHVNDAYMYPPSSVCNQVITPQTRSVTRATVS